MTQDISQIISSSEMTYGPKHYEVDSRPSPTIEHRRQVIMEDVRNNASRMQLDALRDESRCYFGNSPTLSQIGEQYALKFLFLHFASIIDYCGAKREGNIKEQMQRLCREVYIKYNHLKADEIALFAGKFCSGEYQRFYGRFDPLIIQDSLRMFIRDRNEAIDRRLMDEAARERERMFSQPGISRAEYEKLKYLAAQGDEQAKAALQAPAQLTTKNNN